MRSRQATERRRHLPRKVMDTEGGAIHSQALGLYGAINELQQSKLQSTAWLWD